MKKYRIESNIQPIVVGGLVGLTVTSGVILTSSAVSADNTDVVDQVNITVPVSCTMSGSGMASHTAEIQNGTYTPNIGTTTLHTFCNDSEGFAIYATGYTGNEIGGENSNKLVGTPSTIGNIVTGTAESGDTSNWAMKLSISQDSGDTTGTNAVTLDNGFGSYSAVPNQYTKVAHKDSMTDMTASTGGVKLTTTYAAYISKTQPAGTYSGQVIYTLVHPASEAPLQPQPTTAGKICYYPNGNSVEGTMGCQNVSSSVTLLASNFSRNGYGFAGWSDKYDYSAGAKFYGPQETIALNTADYTGDNPGLSLYAVWVKSAGSLQDSSKVATLCGTGSGSLTTAPTDGTASLNSVSALTDARDNQTYAIAKLADGKCWMIENLRLEADDSDDETLAQGFGKSTTYGNFSGLADAESANFTGSTSSATDPTEPNSLYYAGTQSGTATIDISQTNFAGSRMPRYNNKNTQSRASNPTGNGTSIYSYGNYYTWSAALANTIYYSGPTATDADGKTSETVNTSLCPSGWKLPYGGSTGNGATSGGFYNLNYKINNDTNVTDSTASQKIRAFPNNFLYSGYFNTSSANSRGSYGGYWSSTVYYNMYSYYLYLDGSYVYPGTSNDYKYYGLSIRCVAGSYELYP